MTILSKLWKLGLAALLATLVPFAVVVLLPITAEFARAGLDGHKFAQYYILFLPCLWLCCLAVSSRLVRVRLKRPLWAWALSGAAAGYFSSVVSVILLDVFRHDRWHQIYVQSLRETGWALRFGYPLLSLSWLVGLTAMLMLFVLARITLFREGGSLSSGP